MTLQIFCCIQDVYVNILRLSNLSFFSLRKFSKLTKLISKSKLFFVGCEIKTMLSLWSLLQYSVS